MRAKSNEGIGGAMSVHECALALGVCDRTVLRLIDRGELRAFRVGRALRILSGEVERYINSHMVATDEEA